MKDPDLGIYPHDHLLPHPGRLRLRWGPRVPPTAVEDVICVTKAYSSAVGSSAEPFVSEVLGRGRPMSCAAAAVTRASSAPPPAVPAG